MYNKFLGHFYDCSMTVQIQTRVCGYPGTSGSQFVAYAPRQCISQIDVYGNATVHECLINSLKQISIRRLKNYLEYNVALSVLSPRGHEELFCRIAFTEILFNYRISQSRHFHVENWTTPFVVQLDI